jgi:YHS domain-containing protein
MHVRYLCQKIMKKIYCIALLVFNSAFSLAQKPLVFSTSEGALRGYDPVAYFTDAKPTKGTSEFTFNYQGAVWHFASDESLKIFKSDPEKFMPQFGGYCAFGMSRGYKADTEPDAWTILYGKLYMNYNLAVRTEWSKKQLEYIEKANKNWPAIREK